MVLFIARHRSHVTLARGWETEVAVTSRVTTGVPLVVGPQAASPPPDEFLFVQLAARLAVGCSVVCTDNGASLYTTTDIL